MNETTIRQWFDVFKGGKELTEVRILDPASKRSYSGYFTDIDTLLRAVRPYDQCNIYFTLNAIDPACYSREQRDAIKTRPKSTTSDNDIIAREWCLVDIDCEKPSDTNSTDGEKLQAQAVVNAVYAFLRSEGFAAPVVCDSANGYHLLYKQDMAADAHSTETMKKFLQVLDMRFSTEKVKIDRSTFNASRICKLYGCASRKGADTPERPQRESKILRVPSPLRVTPAAAFEKIASFLPVPDMTVRRGAPSNGVFDLDAFIAKHGIGVARMVETAEYTKYVLEECPFNSAHRAPDSCVFKMRDGSYGFKCFHNSDSGYTFKDFRLHFDPHAYDAVEQAPPPRASYAPPRRRHEIKEELPELGKKWLCMSDIKKLDLSGIPRMKTGLKELDDAIVGLFVGEVSIISGSNASGKSSWMNTVMLNVVEQGFKVALWSGELPAPILKNWILSAAAGKDHLRQSRIDPGKYYTPDDVAGKISEWLDGKFFLYNNEYANKWEQIFHDMENLHSAGVKLFILDNLFSLDIDIFDGDKNNKQRELILQICHFAKSKQVHLILVAHPRKVTTFLRKTDISGSSDLTNAVDNVFIVHRINNDFLKTAKEFFGGKITDGLVKYGNCVEVSKNRLFGIVDKMVGMYYESASRRFKNSEEETVRYGWEDGNDAEPLSSLPFLPAEEDAPF